MAVQLMLLENCAVVIVTSQYSGSERVLFLLGSAFGFWMAVRGVKTGEVPLQFATLSRRSHGPIIFWFGIVMNVLIGVMCLLGFIFGRDLWK